MKINEILNTKLDIKLVSNQSNSHYITFQTVINNTTYHCEFEKPEIEQIKNIIANLLDVILTSNFDLKYDDEIISDEHIKQLHFIKTNIAKYKNLWLLSFYVNNDEESDFELTNKYDANSVFSFIKQSFEIFKQTNKINFICFESDGIKRTNVYKRLFTKFLNIKNTFEIKHNNKSFIILEI